MSIPEIIICSTLLLFAIVIPIGFVFIFIFEKKVEENVEEMENEENSRNEEKKLD